MISLLFAGRSERGRRDENQDRVVCEPAAGIFAVVDGMGGTAGGSTAAEVAAMQIAVAGETPLVAIFGAIRDRLAKMGLEERSLWGMGAVATAVRFDAEQVTIAHVGDTRAWRWRADEGLVRLTRDHTVVAEARGMFGLPEDAAMPGGNRVTRDLGSSVGPAEHWVDVREEALRAGDRYLLSSDGLHGVLPAGEIAALFEGVDDEAELADRLVAAALDKGSSDNVSVVVVRAGPVPR